VEKKETADIRYYDDHSRSLEKQFYDGKIIGDHFDKWRPEWLIGSCDNGDSESGEDDGDMEDGLSSDAGSESASDQLPDDDDDPESCSESGTDQSSFSGASGSTGATCPYRYCEIHTDQAREPLEWLFEVKTTLGSCHTMFSMGSKQYDLVSCPFQWPM